MKVVTLVRLELGLLKKMFQILIIQVKTIAIWTAEIMIKTVNDDGKDNPHGKIRVTLNAVAGVNTVASSANDVVITVNDSTKPVIKIGTATNRHSKSIRK